MRMVGGREEKREVMLDSMVGRSTIMEGVSRVEMWSPILGVGGAMVVVVVW